ncbi:MAG: D-alanyl-D-alanine carboxypeptidase/D-alanyl-D-alanine-endopeptidase [Bacteroidota bacterium]
MRITNRKQLLLSLFFITISASAQNLQQKLQSAFGRLQQDSQSRYASASLTVLDAKTGEVLFAANPDMGLAPASTLKTVTSATAMSLLGPDYRFKTTISDVNDSHLDATGTWVGDIAINAGNDPTLGSWRWEQTAEAVVLKEFVDGLKRAGIKKIGGSIIATGVSHTPAGWIWQDVGNYYGAAPNNLCWHENQYDILLKPGKVGQSVQVTGTVPQLPYLHIENGLITGAAGTGDHAYAFLPVMGNVVFLNGTYSIDQQKRMISAAIPDPPFELARRLKDTLIKAGISVSGEPMSETMWIQKTNNADISYGRVFATHYSPPLRKIIYWLNQKSINLYAEQLILAIADSAKTSNGVKVLQDFWKARGIDPESLNIADGSGLSPGDRVTTKTLAQILKIVKPETWFPDYYESLPTYNNMKMKSGTINNGLSFAGYQTKNGRELCFAIIINNYSGSSSAMRQKLFKVLDELK